MNEIEDFMNQSKFHYDDQPNRMFKEGIKFQLAIVWVHFSIQKTWTSSLEELISKRIKVDDRGYRIFEFNPTPSSTSCVDTKVLQATKTILQESLSATKFQI